MFSHEKLFRAIILLHFFSISLSLSHLSSEECLVVKSFPRSFSVCSNSIKTNLNDFQGEKNFLFVPSNMKLLYVGMWKLII
jgi:hypothetical protein